MASSPPARVAPSRLDELLQCVEAAGMDQWRWDIESGEVVWSDGIAELFGLPRGAPVRSFEQYLATLDPADRALVTAAIERAMRGETEDYFVEHRVPQPDGRERWVAGRGRVFRDDAGRPVRMAGVVWDVTARKVNEARLARLQREWSIVREINKQILQPTSQRGLCKDACRIAVELGLFRFAWVGFAAADGRHVEAAASWGYDAGYLEIYDHEAAVAHGQHPSVAAAEEGRPSITQNIAIPVDVSSVSANRITGVPSTRSLWSLGQPTRLRLPARGGPGENTATSVRPSIAKSTSLAQPGGEAVMTPSIRWAATP